MSHYTLNQEEDGILEGGLTFEEMEAIEQEIHRNSHISAGGPSPMFNEQTLGDTLPAPTSALFIIPNPHYPTSNTSTTASACSTIYDAGFSGYIVDASPPFVFPGSEPSTSFQQSMNSIQLSPNPLPYQHLPICPIEGTGKCLEARRNIRVLNPQRTAEIAVPFASQVNSMLVLPAGTLEKTLQLYRFRYKLPLDYHFQLQKTQDGQSWPVRLMSDEETNGPTHTPTWEYWSNYTHLPGDDDEVTSWMELNPVSGKTVRISKPIGQGSGIRIIHVHKDNNPDIFLHQPPNTTKSWEMIASSTQDAADILNEGDEGNVKKIFTKIKYVFQNRQGRPDPDTVWRSILKGKYLVRRVQQEWRERPPGTIRWVAYARQETDPPILINQYSADQAIFSHSEYQNLLQQGFCLQEVTQAHSGAIEGVSCQNVPSSGDFEED